ncbi:MAG: hypothetical protein WCX27_00400 [Candidatus Paceibacterota bacterium]|jgi:hypothetical protein
MAYSKLVVNNLLAICRTTGEDKMFKSQLDIALCIKPDLSIQLKSVKTSAECRELLLCIPNTTPFYELHSEAEKKERLLLAKELEKELENTSETSAAYNKVLEKYPSWIIGYQEALEKSNMFLSTELLAELESAKTAEDHFKIAEKASSLLAVRDEAERRGDAKLYEELGHATTAVECEEIRSRARFGSFVKDRAKQMKDDLECRELRVKLKEAVTPEACRKIRDQEPRESPVWKEADEKGNCLVSDKLLTELGSLTTSAEAREMMEKAPAWSEAQKRAGEIYCSFLEKESLLKLDEAETLEARLKILWGVPKKNGLQEKLWDKVLELFKKPEQLRSCLEMAEPHSEMAKSIIRKAADMLQAQQEESAV